MRALLLGLTLSAAAFATAAVPAGACACGIAIEAEVSGEEALLTWDGTRETMVVKLQLGDAGKDAAVLFPVPSRPTLGQLTGKSDLFAYLAEATAPKIKSSGGEDGAAGGAAPRDVDVLERRRIGAFDVAVLRADDEGALVDWLNENDYKVASDVRTILDDYVARKWSFVAIKLAKAGGGSLRPLKLSFASSRLVYPMKLSQLSDGPVALRLYVNAGSAATASGIEGFDPIFDAPVDELDPPPPADVRKLLTEDHLTRLSISGAPASSVKDDVSVKLVAAGVAGSGGDEDDGMPTVVWIAIALGVAGLGALVVTRLRGRES